MIAGRDGPNHSQGAAGAGGSHPELETMERGRFGHLDPELLQQIIDGLAAVRDGLAARPDEG